MSLSPNWRRPKILPKYSNAFKMMMLFALVLSVTTSFKSTISTSKSIRLKSSGASVPTTIESNSDPSLSTSSSPSIYHRETKEQSSSRPYGYIDSQGIYETLSALANDFPDFATLDSTQTKYNLAAAGKAQDCEFDHHRDDGDTREVVVKGCMNWFLTIEDKISHPKGSKSYVELPEVFLSGALHGNERIGEFMMLEFKF